MAAAPAQQAPAAHRVVAIPYADLKERGKDLSGSIEAGFGPGGLGIVSVSGVPGYPELRKQLLQLAPRVANLPDDAKEELEDAESRYHIGWSYGKEKLESGEPDTLKGSFFANPILDIPTTDRELMNRYPAYCRPNMWPTNHLPELEPNWDEKLQFPSEMPYHQELIPPNRELMFGEYSPRRLDKFTAANGGLVAHRLHAT